MKEWNLSYQVQLNTVLEIDTSPIVQAREGLAVSFVVIDRFSGGRELISLLN